MQNQQPQGPGDKITMKGTFNALYYLSLCHVTCFTPILHKNFGCEALGMNGAGAMVMLLVMWGQDPTGGMAVYFWVWLAALIIRRIESVKRQRQGVIEHSRYDGWPWLALRFVKKESTAKGMVEPFLCFAVGACLLPFSETLGLFVFFGALSMTIVEGTDRQIDKMRVQRMHDMNIESKRTAELYRGRDNY